jgi:hypothetical protein
MVFTMKKLIIALALASASIIAHAEIKWKVTALTPEYILVQADGSDEESVAFFADSRQAELETAKMADWQLARKRLAIHQDVEKTVRDKLAEKIKSIKGFISYWPEANGVKRYVDKNGQRITVKAGEVIHNAFLKVPAMKKGTVVDLGVAGKFTYNPSVPTPVIKVNQVGYVPHARKYAYAGTWLGPAGALPLKSFSGKKFRVVDNASGSKKLEGALTLRRDDPKMKETLSTGEEVLEIDLTPLTAEGEYRIVIDGIGMSMPFKVSNESLAEAWGVHMQGLFNKRCGIEKRPPWTQWTADACHLKVYRGVHPPDEWSYGSTIFPADGKPIIGKDGKIVKFKHFQTIHASLDMCDTVHALSLPGGYHDAADYDRRPMHLVIPRALSLVYLMNPGKFFDGQLSIPESGNGIPDILDEALWGVRHLIKAQQSDGGIGTWIETTGHPGGEYNGPECDNTNHTYFVAIPTHNSCYDFAGTVALVARAYRAAGKEKIAAKLIERAERAWRWAESNPPVEKKMKSYAVNKWNKENAIDVVFKEDKNYSMKLMLTAALNLAAVTGNTEYFTPVVKRIKDLKAETNKASWGWNQFDLMEFALKDQPIVAEIEEYGKDFKRRRINEAEEILKNLETAYPYRTPWFASNHGFVHTMSWGNSHPFRRVQTLVYAHACTGDKRYLEGIYLANDFHNGANPKGETLTSGLGKVYPVRFLELQSNADGIAEYVSGITPYRWTFGVNQDAKNLVYGVDNIPKWPIWRRYANLEQYSVAASEYTVWETILPPAAVLAYIMPEKLKVPSRVYTRKPEQDLRNLPGYWVKP